MIRTLRDLKGKLRLQPEIQQTLEQTNYQIFADHREKAAGIVKNLLNQGIKINLSTLVVGDYLLSSRCAVEYKTIPDFLDSLLDGRMLEQAKLLKQHYERPLIIVEGTENLYGLRRIHPNAIRGMLATLTVSYGIPVLFTQNHADTAALFAQIAKREQEGGNNHFTPHASRKPATIQSQQEYLVSALPGVGMGFARPLLQKFGSAEKVFLASEEALKEVEKIGDKKAKLIREVVTKNYDLANG